MFTVHAVQQKHSREWSLGKFKVSPWWEYWENLPNLTLKRKRGSTWNELEVKALSLLMLRSAVDSHEGAGRRGWSILWFSSVRIISTVSLFWPWTASFQEIHLHMVSGWGQPVLTIAHYQSRSKSELVAFQTYSSVKKTTWHGPLYVSRGEGRNNQLSENYICVSSSLLLCSK